MEVTYGKVKLGSNIWKRKINNRGGRLVKWNYTVVNFYVTCEVV